MMNIVKYFLFVALLSLAFGAYSQTSNVQGTILDANTKTPVPFASVFINQSSIATQSDERGNYILKNLKPGKYELIVKFVGYETYRTEITVEGASFNVNLVLVPTSQQLREVIIKPDLNRGRYLAMFEREFIGNSKPALTFRFRNPSLLFINYTDGKLLEASSDDFLIFENNYLGYRIRHLLNEFTRSYIPGTFGDGVTYQEGVSVFEPMQGNNNKIKTWKKHRLEIYKGSTVHFFRSLIANNVKAEGFTMYRLIKQKNSNRPSDEFISKKIALLRENTLMPQNLKSDSLQFWYKKKGEPKFLNLLVKDSLKRNDVLSTFTGGLYKLSFSDNLYVTYKGKTLRGSSSAYKPLSIPDEVSVGIINMAGAYVLFDKNGIVANPRDLLYEGIWASKMPELLPTDYQPGD